MKIKVKSIVNDLDTVVKNKERRSAGVRERSAEEGIH